MKSIVVFQLKHYIAYSITNFDTYCMTLIADKNYDFLVRGFVVCVCVGGGGGGGWSHLDQDFRKYKEILKKTPARIKF